MLRRVVHNRSCDVVAARAALVARACYSISTMRFNNNKKTLSPEDEAELERERALREKFAQKIGGFNTNIFNNVTGAASSSNNNNNNGGSTSSSSSSANMPGNTTNFARIFFFMSSIYMLLLIAQLENPNSAISMFQGMKWWQVPADTVAYLSLMRLVLPFRDQRRIKSEYEEAQKRDPNLTLSFFFQTRYPAHFQGTHVSQQQAVAAVAACLAASQDINIVSSMQAAAGMARDQRVAIDNIMEALYKAYPHVFAPVPTPSPIGQ